MARLKTPRARFHEFSPENDIRYRGPLTYQHFQFLGWLCIAAVQAAFLMRVCGKADPAYAAENGWLQEMLENMGSMSLPLLLIANFAQILDDSDGYRRTLLKNIAASLLICGLSFLLSERYLIGILSGLSSDPASVEPMVEKLTRALFPVGFTTFNIFIDLLMCSLVMFFLNYQPKRHFTGGWLHVFRLLALLPITYEIGCMVLKVLSAREQITLPLWSFALLPVKPIMTFVLFLILAVFIKTREFRFRRQGKSHTDYQAFLRTNRNSRNFSFFLAVMILVVSLLDITVYFTYYGVSSIEKMLSLYSETEVTALLEELNSSTEQPQESATVAEIQDSYSTAPSSADPFPLDQFPTELLSEDETQKTDEQIVKEIGVREEAMSRALGFGRSVSLLWLIPLVLLFSYTRQPKLKKAGALIPAGMIVLILFLYLETGLFLVSRLHISQEDIAEMTESLSMILQSPQ